MTSPYYLYKILLPFNLIFVHVMQQNDRIRFEMLFIEC